MNLVTKAINQWGAQIIGKPLKSVYGLIHIYDIVDVEHPQELSIEFCEIDNSPKKLLCGPNGTSIVLCEGELSENDLGEYGKEIVMDLSNLKIFDGLIGKPLSYINTIYSEIEQDIIGFMFVFYNYGQFSVMNLGDEIYMFNHIPDSLLKDEEISLIKVS
ncbi:hypothetical protein EAE91_13435 [Photorhabdus noenieputensis]|uniref:hypothetical protein n=1 Tax=Photorhabdus noenieputensis TaxID=1208607 RepID=UPI001BD4DFFB|nr:hypothetical protein [Photorhabdus noenieputensis]MBS9438121.1 hypothetical protein [Photorhabdus noenieputensis]MCK3670313.1 hypothetical protein [Photorhabdus noenieputensis]